MSSSESARPLRQGGSGGRGKPSPPVRQSSAPNPSTVCSSNLVGGRGRDVDVDGVGIVGGAWNVMKHSLNFGVSVYDFDVSMLSVGV